MVLLFQAIECMEIRIRPSPIKCPDGKWTAEATQFFKQVVLNMQFAARVRVKACEQTGGVLVHLNFMLFLFPIFQHVHGQINCKICLSENLVLSHSRFSCQNYWKQNFKFYSIDLNYLLLRHNMHVLFKHNIRSQAHST